MNGFVGALNRNGRWIGWVTVVFLLQIGFIFWLSDYSRPQVRKPAAAPAIHLAGIGSAELLALSDPTLFALPHFRSFSGQAWLRPPASPNHWFEWTEEPRWLPASPEEFPRVDSTASQTASLDAFEVVRASAPQQPSLVIAVPPLFREKSALKVTGSLGNRKLQSLPELPSWKFTDLITNTVVGVVVNADGIPRSERLLVRSGLKEADDYALKATLELRFEPLPGAERGEASLPAGMTWGELVFQWHGIAGAEGAK